MVEFLNFPNLTDKCDTNGVGSPTPLEFTTDMQTLIAKYNYAKKLQTTIDNQGMDTTTLNRKSYYESKEYDNLLLWNFRFYYFYYVMAFILVLILFLSENQFQLGLYTRIFISLLLLVYPYIISYITMIVFFSYQFLSGFMSTNVYNSI